jgi:methylenetetrahydrofolate dehydrogenase (NADP+) / methenyltetrahydrofolate cyclohydrolase
LKILDGNRIRDEILGEISMEVTSMERPPTLTVVQVGDDGASAAYIRNKIRACKKTGIVGDHRHLSPEISQGELNRLIAELSLAPEVDGIILQLPLPSHLDENEAMSHLDPAKDVDGFHPINLGRLITGQESLLPCTPAGIREILRREEISTRGKDVVILGRSVIVGKPAALLFLEKGVFGDATVTVCHSASTNLADHCRRADILVAAVGRAHFVGAEMVKEGAVVVDVGMNSLPDPGKKSGYRLVGDCDYEALAPRVSAMTPVPGGVGPMTVTMLLKNTLIAARRRIGEGN